MSEKIRVKTFQSDPDFDGSVISGTKYKMGRADKPDYVEMVCYDGQDEPLFIVGGMSDELPLAVVEKIVNRVLALRSTVLNGVNAVQGDEPHMNALNRGSNGSIVEPEPAQIVPEESAAALTAVTQNPLGFTPMLTRSLTPAELLPAGDMVRLVALLVYCGWEYKHIREALQGPEYQIHRAISHAQSKSRTMAA